MLFIKRSQRSLYVNTQYFFFSSLFHLYFLIDKTFLFFSRTISRSTVMACFGFLIPFLTRFVLYFGNKLTSSSDNSLRVEIAALAISRVNTVVLSDAFNRVNDIDLIFRQRSKVQSAQKHVSYASQIHRIPFSVAYPLCYYYLRYYYYYYYLLLTPYYYCFI